MINYNKVFVTGATGLVGSHIVCELLKKGKEVGLSYRSEKTLQNLYKKLESEGLTKNITSYKVDLESCEPLAEILKNYDVVVHAAADVNLSANSKSYIHKNISLTKAVVWAATNASIKRFIHISSIATLGEFQFNGKMIDETCEIDSLMGRSSYSVGKFHCENEVFRAMNEGLNGIIINPSVIIGYQDGNQSSSKIITALSKPIKFYTSGVTGYVGVRDVAKCVTTLIDSDLCSQRFVISSENLSYKELMSKSAKFFKHRAPTVLISDKLVNTLISVLSFIERLGLTIKVSSSMVDCFVSKKYYDGTKITKHTDFKYSNIDAQLEECIKEFLLFNKNINTTKKCQ